jgi:hypothetical protein
MGTSYVEYKGFGFWSRDNFLASWINAVLEEMRELPQREPWQQSLMEHWRVQAEIDSGCISLGLDGFVSDAVKRDFVLSLARRAIERGTGLSKRTGELFIELLSGQLKTNASSPIDYL